ncbi:MAG: DegT/DnrJ/EryC1/StrS family aminotransferase [Candidatus Omnitrophica bacterium]|nr:DegT/DnrJ/EryC1/StrS family aminotransferase [Candidatus Omnitrophota bacterium]
MPERILPWWQLQLTGQERLLVNEVLESGFLNDGEMTTRFEAQLAALLGVRHVVGVTSCTAALFLSLVSVGIGKDDEVIVPDLTFIATANAVTLAGARPVLVDIDPRTLTLDPDAFARAITSRTRAVIPVHISGRGADMRSILAIASQHGTHVIEDAAEALMSKCQGRALGTHGLLGCLSFSPAKIITTGQGGAVVTNAEALHIRLRELKDQGRPVRGTGGNDMHRSVGYNFKLTNLQAAVGLGQLTSLSERMARMQRTYRTYLEGLKGVAGFRLFPFNLGEGESPQWIDAYCEDRDALVEHLRVRGADCRKYWFPLHVQPPYRQSDERFPQSTAIAQKLVWLPSALSLSDEDVATICAWIREFYAARQLTPRRAVSVSAATPL